MATSQTNAIFKSAHVSNLFAILMPAHSYPTSRADAAALGSNPKPAAVCSKCTSVSCCITEGPISLTPLDILKLSTGLRMNPVDFLDNFTQDHFPDDPTHDEHVARKGNGVVTNLRRKTKYSNSECIFLAPVPTAPGESLRYTCSVHPFRPMACREFYYDGCRQSVSNELGVMVSSGLDILGRGDESSHRLRAAINMAWDVLKNLNTETDQNNSLEGSDNRASTGDLMAYNIVRRLYMAANGLDEPFEAISQYLKGDWTEKQERMLNADFLNSANTFSPHSLADPNITLTPLMASTSITPRSLDDMTPAHELRLDHAASARSYGKQDLRKNPLPIYYGTRFELQQHLSRPDLPLTKSSINLIRDDLLHRMQGDDHALKTRDDYYMVGCMVNNLAYLINFGHWICSVVDPTDKNDLDYVYGELSLLFDNVTQTSPWLVVHPDVKRALAQLRVKLRLRYRQYLQTRGPEFVIPETPHWLTSDSAVVPTNMPWDRVDAYLHTMAMWDRFSNVYAFFSTFRGKALTPQDKEVVHKFLTSNTQPNSLTYRSPTYFHPADHLIEGFTTLINVRLDYLHAEDYRINHPDVKARQRAVALMFCDQWCVDQLYSFCLNPLYPLATELEFKEQLKECVGKTGILKKLELQRAMTVFRFTMNLLDLVGPELRWLAKRDMQVKPGATITPIMSVYNIVTHLAYGYTLYGRFHLRDRSQDSGRLSDEITTFVWTQLHPIMLEFNIHATDPETIAEFIDATQNNLYMSYKQAQDKPLVERFRKDYLHALDVVVKGIELNGSVNAQVYDRSQRYNTKYPNTPTNQDEFLYLAYHSAWTTLDALRSHFLTEPTYWFDVKDEPWAN